jgi:heme/copper-type cytochrome/quinol oxidase subunit 1
VGVRYLRRAWLIGIACVAAVGMGSALLMRINLVDPGPGQPLSPTAYSQVFALHGVAMFCLLVAALVAIPALVVRPGRGAIVLGSIAFAIWALVSVLLVIAALAPSDWVSGSALTPGALRAAHIALAIAIGVAVAQLAASLPANSDGQSGAMVAAAVGAIIGLAIVGIPLAVGSVPTSLYWLTATTVTVSSLIPALIGSRAASIVWLAVVPCLAAAWIATALVHVSPVFLADTTAMVAPFPALGGAIFATLFVAACRDRAPSVAAVVFAGGAIATTVLFIVLGMRGMPRRYAQYDTSFQPLQIAIGVAAAVTVLGAIAALWSTRGKPAER